MEEETKLICDNTNNFQNVMFPINNNDNVFIFPPSLRSKLPDKVINIIQPSKKYIPPFNISKFINKRLRDPSSNQYHHYLPHIPDTNQVHKVPLSKQRTLHTKKVFSKTSPKTRKHTKRQLQIQICKYTIKQLFNHFSSANIPNKLQL